MTIGLKKKLQKNQKLSFFGQFQRQFKASCRGQNTFIFYFLDPPKSVDNFSYPHHDHNMNRSQAKNKTKFEILKKKFFFKFWKLYQKKLKMFPKNQIFAKMA